MHSTNLCNILRLRIIRLEPSFFDLLYTPDTNVLFSVIFALTTMFFPLSNATAFFTVNSCSYESENANLELDFGVSIRSSFSPFSITSRIILLLVTFFHLVKWFLRFPPVELWISLLTIGIISCWNFKLVVVATLLQLSFSCGIAIVDILVVIFGGFCNLWFGWCYCTPCVDFQGFLEIFASFIVRRIGLGLQHFLTCLDCA